MKVFRTICDVLFAALLVVVLSMVVVVVAVPRAMGGMSLTVLSGSMEPGIKPGDMVATRAVDASNHDSLGIGSVIVFLPYPDDPTLVTHRIVAVSAEKGSVFYTTKGDNVKDVDPWGPVAASHVRGQVVYVIPKVGYLSNWITNRFPLAATIAGVVLIGYGVVVFISSLIRRETPRRGGGPTDRPHQSVPRRVLVAAGDEDLR